MKALVNTWNVRNENKGVMISVSPLALTNGANGSVRSIKESVCTSSAQ